jgi:hypothetical protein
VSDKSRSSFHTVADKNCELIRFTSIGALLMAVYLWLVCLCRESFRHHVRSAVVLLAEAGEFLHFQKNIGEFALDSVPVLQVFVLLIKKYILVDVVSVRASELLVRFISFTRG